MTHSSNKRDRQERFKKVSERRLKSAVEAIQSLGKLSNTNYVYSEKEVLEIFAKLNFEVKDNLSKFSTGFSDRKPLSAEEKFLRLIELDRYQLMELKKTDPDVYDYALKHLPNSSIQIMPDEEDDISPNEFMTEYLEDDHPDLIAQEAKEWHAREIEEDVQFEKDILHWISYDYVVINDNLQDCYTKIHNLIYTEIKNGSKDYDPEYIRNHIRKLTS